MKIPIKTELLLAAVAVLLALILAALCTAICCRTCGEATPQTAPVSSAADLAGTNVPVTDSTETTAVPTEPTAEPSNLPATEPADDELVRVRDYLPTIAVELRYASSDNFTGQTVYSFSEAYLRYGTVKKLISAQAGLSESGLGLKLWDAFRPTEAQFVLWELCPDPVYVSNPNKGFSNHSRGDTVDVTLIGPDGKETEMPTGFDDFSAKADRDYSDVSGQAAANARLLEEVMSANGFSCYSGEWWHFSDTDDYPVYEGKLPGE